MDDARPARGAFAVSGLLLLSPPVAAAGGLGLAPLVAAAGLAGAPLRSLAGLLRRNAIIVALIAAFTAWAALSSVWSPRADAGQNLRLLGGVATGLLLLTAVGVTQTSRSLIRAAALAALIVLAAILIIEALYGMPLNRIGQPDAEQGALMRNPGRGVSVLVLIYLAGLGGWLASGAAFRIIAALAAPALVWLGLQFDMDANAVALALGALAFVVTFALPRLGLIVASGGLAVWLLLAPWLMPVLLNAVQARIPRLPDSWAIRVEIWRFVSERIAEQPILGHGLDAARSFTQTRVTNGIEHPLVPLHPHSASLQIWLETGAIGASLAAFALLVGGWMAAKALSKERAIAASAAALMTALGLYWNVSYGAWQEWMIAIAFACAAIVIASRRRIERA